MCGVCFWMSVSTVHDLVRSGVDAETLDTDGLGERVLDEPKQFGFKYSDEYCEGYASRRNVRRSSPDLFIILLRSDYRASQTRTTTRCARVHSTNVSYLQVDSVIS